ncbi:MAG: hypothetical protein R8G66_06960 [Cytophagales bacterium]|nr:hypothetical protein [Cytophagales bacterium]
MKRLLIFLCFLVAGFSVVAQSAVKKDLYQAARKSFARGKYVDALASFSEFKGANGDYLTRHPELNRAIISAIGLCEDRIKVKEAEKEKEAEQSNGIKRTSINVSAVIEDPGPIYLLATETTIDPLVKNNFVSYLDIIRGKPFWGIEINCLTNVSSDSLEQYNYSMNRIVLFKEILEEEGISPNRIIWKVENIADDPYRLQYCLNLSNPEKGALCIEPSFNRRMEIFNLEP